MCKICIFNAEVITVNASDEIAEAIVLEGNKIKYVGSNDEALAMCEESDTRIDAEGKTVMPGFVEAHLHIVSRLVLSAGMDMSKRSGINCIADIQNRLKEAKEKSGAGEWILGHGLTFEDLDERRWPTRWELDEVCPDTPVAITHSSGHTGLYNTKALELCHVLDGTMDYSQPHIMKDGNNVPTGVLTELAHFKCSSMVSDFNPVTKQKVEKEILNTVAMMNSMGITSGSDAGGTGAQTLEVMQKLALEDRLTCRMYPMVFSILSKADNLELLNANIRSGFHTGLGDEKMKIGPLKLMVDGSGASGTCATREPMSHNGAMCPSSYTQEEIDDIYTRGHAAGWQIASHCIGDRGVEMMLNGLDKAQAACPREDYRPKVEHCMIAEPDLLERIKAHGAIPTFNPAFINLWGTSFNKYYQGSRNAYLIALRSAIDMGIQPTISSDWECIPDMSPLIGIASAMDREIYATGEKVAPNQAITLLEAIRCTTLNAARSSFEEDIKGSLEVGKLADVIMLDGRITEKTPREIHDMSVAMTFFDGRLVYEKE